MGRDSAEQRDREGEHGMNMRNLTKAIAVAAGTALLSIVMFGLAGIDLQTRSRAEPICNAPERGSCMRLRVNSGAGVVGTWRQVRATLVDSSNTPLAGHLVRITLEETPNPPQTVHHVTDLWGQVTFTYLSTDPSGAEYVSVCETPDFGAPCTQATATAELQTAEACPTSTPSATTTPGGSTIPTATPCATVSPAAVPPTGGRP